MSIKLSVIIPTHKPNYNYLNRVLQSLKHQDYEYIKWEILIIDNVSDDVNFEQTINICWHPNYKIIREKRLGLTYARIAGIKSSNGEFIVLVDDDNLLSNDYLRNVVDIFERYAQVGSIGGKSFPEFEITPEEWTKKFYKSLALRDLGDQELITNHLNQSKRIEEYPDFSPIGAGMAFRRDAINKYVENVINGENVINDRTGNILSSGGDNDIVLTLLNSGWEVGYFPKLQITHLIPAYRVTKEYIARVCFDSSKSWIKVLDKHGICPWDKIPKWTILPRNIKAYFNFKAWKDEESYINWRGACGMFEGLGDLM